MPTRTRSSSLGTLHDDGSERTLLSPQRVARSGQEPLSLSDHCGACCDHGRKPEMHPFGRPIWCVGRPSKRFVAISSYAGLGLYYDQTLRDPGWMTLSPVNLLSHEPEPHGNQRDAPIQTGREIDRQAGIGLRASFRARSIATRLARPSHQKQARLPNAHA